MRPTSEIVKLIKSRIDENHDSAGRVVRNSDMQHDQAAAKQWFKNFDRHSNGSLV